VERDRPHPPTASYHSSPPEESAGSTESGRRLRANQLVGSVLVERFELLRLIGVGAFGEVYHARDRQNPNTALALKILRRPSAQALYRFKREFRALGEWSHPNLVALHELFLDDETAFFSMELVAGVDFQSYVRPAGQLDHGRLLTAMRGLSDGVSALHERGRLHRDLKPANVLVESSGRVVIVDLGLATLFGRGGGSGSEAGFVGTVQYAAPEQLALGAVGPETDWYAVGTMLYEALSGALPYDAAFAEQLRQKSRPPAALTLAGDELDPLRRVCMALLQPDRKLRVGAEAVRAACGRSAAPTIVREPPFVGRERELSRLLELFQEVESGAARVALVSAQSGLGKTALVERFLHDLSSEHRATVLRGRCYVNEEVTYQAVDGSIDALSHHLSNLPRLQVAALLPRDVRSLSTLFPVLNRVDAVASAPPVRSLDDKVSLRERAATALRELVARLSDRLPLVLFIDDIQWDDDDSAWLLTKLLAPPDPPAVMLIVTCRSDGRAESSLLRDLAREPAIASQIREIEVPGLSPEQAATLAAHASTVVLEERALADRIAAESGGHPLFALELARFAHGHARDAGQVQLSLDAAILGRAETLSTPARRLFEIVCVSGHPLKYTAAVSAAACEVDAVRELVTSKLVSISGTASEDTLSIYHDRIRDSQLAALPPDYVKSLHGALADAMAQDERRFDRIVEHYLAAGQREAAARFALRAADQAAAVLAFNRVPALLLLAIEHPKEQEELAALYDRLAESYALLGRRSQAADAYEEAVKRERDEARRWELASFAMWQAFDAQDLERGFRLLSELDRQLGGGRLQFNWRRILEGSARGIWWRLFGPPKLRAKRTGAEDSIEHRQMRLAFRAYTSVVTTRTDHAVFYAIEAFRLAAKLGDAAIYSTSLAGFVVFGALRSGRATRNDDKLFDRAQALAAAQPDLGARALVESCHTAFQYVIGKPAAERLRPLLEGEFPVTPFGTFLRSLILYTLGGPILLWSGRIALARVLGARAIADARQLPNPQIESGLRAVTAYRLLGDDEAELAWSEWLSTCERFPEHPALQAPTFGMVIALYQGRLDRARIVMDKCWQLFLRWEVYLRPNRALIYWWWGALVAARIASGEKNASLRFQLWLTLRLLGPRPLPFVAALATSLRATHAFLSGRAAHGVRLLEAAKREADASDMRVLTACISHALGALHHDEGERSKHATLARELFETEKIRRPDKWVRAFLAGLPLTPLAKEATPAE
jgi:eukaryotic-like serine/threonine-protein kinase